MPLGYPIKLSGSNSDTAATAIQKNFTGDTSPYKFADYYKGGTYVKTTDYGVTNIGQLGLSDPPAPIKFSQFNGAAKAYTTSTLHGDGPYVVVDPANQGVSNINVTSPGFTSIPSNATIISWYLYADEMQFSPTPSTVSWQINAYWTNGTTYNLVGQGTKGSANYSSPVYVFQTANCTLPPTGGSYTNANFRDYLRNSNPGSWYLHYQGRMSNESGYQIGFLLVRARIYVSYCI